MALKTFHLSKPRTVDWAVQTVQDLTDKNLAVVLAYQEGYLRAA